MFTDFLLPQKPGLSGGRICGRGRDDGRVERNPSKAIEPPQSYQPGRHHSRRQGRNNVKKLHCVGGLQPGNAESFAMARA